MEPFGGAPDDGEIGPLQPAIAAVGGELLGQDLMGLIVLGDHQKARGVLVEAMNDAGAPHTADA